MDISREITIGGFIIDLHFYPKMRFLDLFGFLRSGATQVGSYPPIQASPVLPPPGRCINMGSVDDEGSWLTTASGFESL